MDLINIASWLGLAGIILIIIAIVLMVICKFHIAAVIVGLIIAGAGAYLILVAAGVLTKPAFLDSIPSTKWSIIP